MVLLEEPPIEQNEEGRRGDGAKAAWFCRASVVMPRFFGGLPFLFLFCLTKRPFHTGIVFVLGFLSSSKFCWVFRSWLKSRWPC